MPTDAKPARRIVDRYVYVLFHDRQWSCISCGRERQIVAHHLISKGQGGDDVMANLVPLCDPCHKAYHGNPYRAYGNRVDAAHVKRCLARYVRSEPGEDSAAYLISKLGPFGAEALVMQMEVAR